MFSGMLKFFIGVSLFAAMAGSLLSTTVSPYHPAAKTAAAPADAGKSWYSGLFQGISITRPQAAAPAPAPVVAAAPAAGAGYGRVEITPGPGGQYLADVEIEGLRIPMLVDTGATLISLTSEDADRLGVHPAPSDYKVDIQTANGPAKAARINLGEVRLGTLTVRSVDTIVLPREVTGRSLLGMSFLKKLGGFEVASGTLVLRQ